jgi:hypothetical protein
LQSSKSLWPKLLKKRNLRLQDADLALAGFDYEVAKPFCTSG